MRILLVEDETHLAEALCQILKKNNYSVDLSEDGEEGLDNALTGIYDLVILDIMLPGINGLAILKKIREASLAMPVLMLTAKGELSDKVTGLDCGADDYIAKPFATEELLARIRALSRRRGDVAPESNLHFGDLELNPSSLKLTCHIKEVKLTLKESELLEFLLTRKNSCTPKELIIEKLWGYDSEAENNHVEVYVSFLRKKLQFLGSQVLINAVRGVGYVLEVKSDV